MMAKRTAVMGLLLALIFCCAPVAAQDWRDLLGRADSLLSEHGRDSAIVIGRLALEQAEAAFGPQDTTVASVLKRLGEYFLAEFSLADFEEAESVMKRALTILQDAHGNDHLSVADCANNLAVLYARHKRFAESESLLEQALTCYERLLGPDDPEIAASLRNLGNVYMRQGRYAEAEAAVKRSLAIRTDAQGPEHEDVGKTLNTLANIYARQGKYAEAENLQKQSLAIKEDVFGQDHPEVAVSLNNLGNLAFYQCKYPQAESYFERCIDICEKLLGQEHPFTATSLNNLANVYANQGVYVKAESLYKRSLAIAEKLLGPDHPEVATKLDNLAHVYLDQGRFDEAQELCQRSLAIEEGTFGPDHPSLASNLRNLANIRVAQGKYAEAESLHERSLNIWESAVGPNHTQVATSLEMMCKLYRIQRNYSLALTLARRACNIRRVDFAENGTVLSEKDALTYSFLLWQSLCNYLACYSELEHRDGDESVRAADLVFSCKGRVSDEIFSRQKALVRETDSSVVALAESFRLAKFQLSKLFVKGPGADLEAYRQQVDSLQRLVDEREADLSRRSATFRRGQELEEISVTRLAALLPEHSVLVEYLKYNHYEPQTENTSQRYLAVVLDCSGATEIIDLGDAHPVDSLVERYRKHMLRVAALGLPQDSDQSEYEEISRQLCLKTWVPLAKHVAGKDLIFIAPDDALNLVSFAGLTEGNGTYLIEKHEINYLTCGRDLRRLQEDFVPGRGLLAIGDPDYNASFAERSSAALISTLPTPDGVSYGLHNLRSSRTELSHIGLSPLPATRIEVEKVAISWRRVSGDSPEILLGRAASEERFKAMAPGKKVIHLATHGYFLGGKQQPGSGSRGFVGGAERVTENPLLWSGLYFAGANLQGRDADSAGVDDGVLTAYEVTALDLYGAELVVLSACETGLGMVEQGEGVYGLRRSFQLAGARTVVCALWPVPDKETAELMSELYQQSSETIPEKMRRVQLAQIEKHRELGLADHPYTWSGFIATGDWR